MSDDLSDLGGVNLSSRNPAGSSRYRRLMLGRSMADQVQGRLNLFGKIGRFPVPVNMHVEDTRGLKEEMIVQGSDLQPLLQQRGHYGIHLILKKDEVTHHHLISPRALSHRDPAAEAKRCRSRDSVNGYFEIIPRDVDLQNVGFIIALLIERLDDACIVRRRLLGENADSKSQQETHRHPEHINSPWPRAGPQSVAGAPHNYDFGSRF